MEPGTLERWKVIPRALVLAMLVVACSHAASGQTLTVLHIKVVLVDADGKATPVPHHALLLSDNPATAPPRLVTTAADGTATLRLRPGNYTLESDRPVAFQGKSYQWTQIVDIVAGRDVSLELTAGNAEIESRSVSSATTTGAPHLEADPVFIERQWQDSVVALWTAKTRASGFLIDARGLIATNQRAIGTATSVEVQITKEIKVAARVLAADSERDVTVLWIDPQAVTSVRPVPLGCNQAAKPPVINGQELFTIGAPLSEPKGMTSGTVSRVEPRTTVADFTLAAGSAGGPVFTAEGVVVGVTSDLESTNDQNVRRSRYSRVVRVDAVCEVVASAEKKMGNAAPPDGTHLPVEPTRPFPQDTLKEAAQRRVGNLSPYQMSSSDFDVVFITPVLLYGAQDRGRTPDSGLGSVRPLVDFGNWSDYVADLPPVLLVRVTPKMVESFWTTVARGAASTQGVSLPPIKHFKAGFSRMRAFCGDAEVTPIHPFKIEQRLSESDAIDEGLYVFDPGALGPHCGTVKLALYSEKAPEKTDTRVVDPKVVQQIWQDTKGF